MDVLTILEYLHQHIDHAQKKADVSGNAKWGIFMLDYSFDESKKVPRFQTSTEKIMNGVFNIRAREPKDLKTDAYMHYVNQVKRSIKTNTTEQAVCVQTI